ncbi:hypothetical protein Maes01_00768 [Microbulbifer aestuariivivens]|uniref:N-acetyltransferase domain-containing protein n=1 Tax=Microbulbifer aestuariivivens TaxID=1908308 RepID=A0ABP9WMH2_9GAMM
MAITMREIGVAKADAIRAICLDAFGTEGEEGEGPAVASLAVALLADETAQPCLALLAEEEGEPCGCVIFSAVRIEGGDPIKAPIKVSILAPLAVSRHRHGGGIGGSLVRRGLELLRERGTEAVLVYGDPAYYSRFGFSHRHQIQAPYPLSYPAEAWMALELRPGALDSVTGVARCGQALSAPEHW